jgi:hypothetical protein
MRKTKTLEKFSNRTSKDIEISRHDDEDDPLPNRRPSKAFSAALEAVERMGGKRKT